MLLIDFREELGLSLYKIGTSIIITIAITLKMWTSY